MNPVVRGDSNEILVERTVMDRAEAQPIRHVGISPLLKVADDVRSVKQARLLQATDGAAVVVGEENTSAKARLVQADAGVSYGVLPLEWIARWHRLAFIDRPGHASGCDEHSPRAGVVV